MHDEGDSSDEPVLDLLTLCDGLPALTPAGERFLAENAAVCFEAAGHQQSEATMALHGIRRAQS